ncbi:MAG TPA: tyrosine-type recombinase/integrase [Clostridia bacterium]|nr:tyrosine-type recombinase/integrase [Clostridia bacterium]
MQNSTKKDLRFYFSEFMKDNYLKNLSPDTIDNYDYYCTRFLDFLDTKDIIFYNQITNEVISEYVYKSRRTTNPISTNTALKSVRRFCNFIAESRNFRKIKITLLKEPEVMKKTFSKYEVSKIFHYTNPCLPMSIAAVFMLGTGVRSRTMRGIQVYDLDFGNKIVTCRQTKNGKILILPLTDFLVETLLKYIDYNKLELDDYLIFNKFRNPYSKTGFYSTMGRYLKQIGINKTGIHIFRHTFAKNMILNHSDAFTLQRWLGHAKLDETKKYVALFSEDLMLNIDEYNPASKKNIAKSEYKIN